MLMISLFPGFLGTKTFIDYYFNNAFSENNNITTVRFIWKQLLCSLIKEQRDHLQDGNLTSIVTGSTGKWRQSGKCAHRLC